MLRFADPIVGGTTLLRPAIRSPNYVPATSGWTVNQDGSAEFNNLIVRDGEVIGGTALYYAAPGPGAGTLVASIAAAAGTDPYGNPYPSGLGVEGQNLPPLTGSLTGALSTAYPGTSNLSVMSLSATESSGGSVQLLLDALGKQVSTTAAVVLGDAYRGAAPRPVAFIPPSSDSSGATDAAAINNALSLGWAVQLAPATYYVNVPIQVPGYGILRGAGRSQITKLAMTVIQATAAMSAVICSSGWLQNTQTQPALGINVSWLKLDGNSLASNGIVLQTSDSVIDSVGIENVLFQGILFTAVSHSGAVIVTGNASNNRVVNCSIDGCQNGLKTNESGGSVFTDGFLVNSIIASCTGPAVIIQKSGGWLISGNHLYGLQQHGLQLGELSNTRVTGNYIESWGQGATAGTWRAIDADTLTTSVGAGSVIAHNTVWLGAAPGNAASGIEGINFKSAAASTVALILAGNQWRCVPAAGFASAVAITWTNTGATSVINGVSTGNQITGNWTGNVTQVPNGGTITLTTGV